MNKIEKLIKEMCPNGVEYKKLDDVLEYFQPTKYVANKIEKTKTNEYAIPVLTPGKTFILGWTNEKNNIFISGPKNPVIIFDDFTTDKKWVDFDFKVKSSAIKILKNIDNNISNIRYIWFWFSTFKFTINMSVHKRYWISEYSQIKIPIPPIEIQNEIVKILDTFTQLEAELEAELKARDKQYQYYRNKLLDFDNNQKLLQKLFEKDNKEIDNTIYYNKLKDVFDIKNGFTPSKNNNEFWENGTIPWFKLDDIRSNGRFLYDSKIKVNEKAILNKKVFKSNSIIISTTATIGEHALIKSDFICNQQFTVFSLNNVYEKLVIPKFVFYYFFNISNMLKNKTKNINLPIININEINNMNIPIPSLEIQTKIVNILDKLQDYSKDIKTSLPLEIEQRQKQYEYYRNLLLDFKANVQGGGISE